MNVDLHDMNDDLLVKYLLGELSERETRDVEDWILATPENRRYFEHFKLIWEQSRELIPRRQVNEDLAWKRFQQRIGQQSSEKGIVKTMNRRFTWVRYVAAAMILAIAVRITLYLVNGSDTGSPENIRVATANITQTDTLPDGSIVTLNRHSALTYPNRFKRNGRAVSLQGEAFFHVTPDKEKPFTVTINDVTVTVLGTSFNIKSDGQKTEVIVETGLVRVTKADRFVELKPKEKLVVAQKDSLLSKEGVNDQLYKYYREKKFVCDNTPLWKLVQVLNEAYDAHIVIERSSLRSLPLTATYDELPLDDVLKLVVGTFYDERIEIEKRDSMIILK